MLRTAALKKHQLIAHTVRDGEKKSLYKDSQTYYIVFVVGGKQNVERRFFLFVGNAFAVCGVYGNESVARTATVWKIWSKWRLRTPSENHQADKRFWCRAFCRITNTLSPIIFNSRLPKWQVNMVTVTGFPSNYFY